MTGQEAAKLVAMLHAAFPDATVMPQTNEVYALALDRYEYVEVECALATIIGRHEWPQRLPSPKEIMDAIPTPWPLYNRYSKLRRRVQDGDELTAGELNALAVIEQRLGVPLSCRLGVAAKVELRTALDQPRAMIGAR